KLPLRYNSTALHCENSSSVRSASADDRIRQVSDEITLLPLLREKNEPCVASKIQALDGVDSPCGYSAAQSLSRCLCREATADEVPREDAAHAGSNLIQHFNN